MLSIENNMLEITGLIKANKSKCKVLLKTGDDPILLPIWINHYLRIFAPEQIIIADNKSETPAVLDIYNTVMSSATVFTYDADKIGFHNNIHDRRTFPQLYESISASCEYLLSVDTDELFYIADESSWTLEKANLESLLDRAQGKAVSTTWVHTTRGSLDTFYIGKGPQRLAWDLRWGKPFVPSIFSEPGVRIHNTQFPRGLFDPALGVNCFLLHLVFYSKEQRLRVNKRKLIARGAANESDALEDIVSRDYKHSKDPTVTRLVSEISGLLAEEWATEPDPSLPSTCVRYAPDGRVQYGSADAETAMKEFIQGFSGFFEDGFAPKT
jgi:hypothetical protein